MPSKSAFSTGRGGLDSYRSFFTLKIVKGLIYTQDFFFFSTIGQRGMILMTTFRKIVKVTFFGLKAICYF